ncbi:MAG: exodeoxyribonuclease VII large subunit [Chloroflexi bacterium]|nr:exodeoxyribonuclease VII large subunit [Chloroflexota bacterium]
MDVTVSHLNNRLALQLPMELPLGLVFVVGTVQNLEQTPNGRFPHIQFALVEQTHGVHCVLSPRAAGEAALQTGMTVRAGGHLTFDPEWARYYLLVRDVEVVQPASVGTPDVLPLTDLGPMDRTAVAAILSDIKKRSDAAHLPQADLPSWVQKIAPPEVKAQMEPLLSRDTAGLTPLSPFRPSAATAGLSSDLLARLSAAMDSEEEVELTADMLTDLAEDLAIAPAVHAVSRPYDVPPPAELRQVTAVSQPPIGWEDPDAYAPRSRRGTDYLVGLFFVVFALLAVALIAAIVMMIWPL